MKQIFILCVMLFGIIPFYSQAQVADKVIHDAKIYTADASNTFAQALAVKDGKLIYIGTDAGVTAHIGSGTEIIDANGKLILPGMHDVHIHALESSSDNGASCILNSQETNPENYKAVLQNCNAQVNTNGWIMGWGHSIYTLLNATRKPRLILDEVFPTTPVLIMEETSHSFWINTAGLNAIGFTMTTPDPVGGHILKGKWGDGTPDGILLDNAGDKARELAMATNTTFQNNNYDGLVNYGLPLLAKNGITSLVDGRTYWKENFIETWQQIKTDNKLTCRVGLCPWVYPEENDATQIPKLQSLYDVGDDLLKIRQIKLYSDGITINATAALHEPYNDNLGFPFNKGLNYIDETRMTTLIKTLEQTGYDFFIHAIGDRGITESLNAIEAARTANGDLGRRHRLTHLEIMKPTDYPRFAALKVLADVQVTGDFTNPNHWHDNDQLIGAERSNNLVPLKSLHNEGATITLSSDWNVSSLSPFVGIQNSLTRAPQELPDVATAIKAYTINGAFTMRQETVTGSLELGKYADLIMVDRDLFTIPTNQIKHTKVIFTWLAGNEVYKDQALSVGEVTVHDTGFDVYPTVAHDEVHVYFKNALDRVESIAIYDLRGQLVQNYQTEAHHHGDEFEFHVSGVAEGMYLVRLITTTNKQFTKKFIVSR